MESSLELHNMFCWRRNVFASVDHHHTARFARTLPALIKNISDRLRSCKISATSLLLYSTVRPLYDIVRRAFPRQTLFRHACQAHSHNVLRGLKIDTASLSVSLPFRTIVVCASSVFLEGLPRSLSSRSSNDAH